jgi:hypothetical protein
MQVHRRRTVRVRACFLAIVSMHTLDFRWRHDVHAIATRLRFGADSSKTLSRTLFIGPPAIVIPGAERRRPKRNCQYSRTQGGSGDKSCWQNDNLCEDSGGVCIPG